MSDCDFLYGLYAAKPMGDDNPYHAVIMSAETDPDMKAPLLWAALFDASDAVTVTKRRELDDGAEEAASEYAAPVWHTSIKEGLRRFGERKPWILDHTHPMLHPFVDAFEEKIRDCGYTYMQMDFSSLFLWMEKDADHVHSLVRSGLEALASKEGWDAWANRLQLISTYDLYGKNFMLSENPGGVVLGWFRVGSDNRIEPEGFGGSV